MSENIYANVKAIVEVSSVISCSCAVCDYWIDHDKFSEAVNHYIEEHGFKILHVGNRTLRDYGDHPCDTSIAILGSDALLPKR